MPPRGTEKQGDTATPGAVPKSDQRRARNRLAQRAIRERKNAHIQHLEQQLALAQKGEGDARLQALLDENEKLRKAFLTVRKKLLSLSTTSSLLADSLLPFLDAGTASPNQPMSEINSLSESERSSATDSSGTLEQFSMAGICASQDEPILDPVNPPSLLQTDQEYGAAGSFEERALPIQPHVLGADTLNICRPLVACDSITASRPYAGALDNPSHLYFPLGHMPTTTGFAVNTPHMPNSLSHRRSALSDHIDFIRYTIRANGLANSSSLYPPRIMYSILEEYLQQCWPAMLPWFRITQTSQIICSVLWWQISNSEAAARQLHKIHTPTAVQLSVPHPSILDWVPHSALRDHFILNQDSLDLDAAICDLAAAYAVEFEPDGDPAVPKTTLNLMDAVNDSLQSGIPLLDSAGREGSGQSIYSAGMRVHSRRKPLSTGNIHKYKIDSSFFVKYPALYDPSSVADGIADVPITLGIVQPPIQFNPHSAQAYITTSKALAASY